MKENNRDNSTKKYPWLSVSNSVEEYVSPDYYKKLLKKYSFNGISDLDYLKTYINDLKAKAILELGCGSGRATKLVLDKHAKSEYTLVDLSERMIKYTKDRFYEKRNLQFHISDSIEFLQKTKRQYDLIYSLWSLSHSIHQHVHQRNFKNASRYVGKVLTKFIHENMKKGGRFYLIHFDSMSDEQQILMPQWKRVFTEFSDLKQQSPSKRILDSVLHDLDNRNEIILSVNHMRGEPIIYKDENELLEIFFNLHMETYFNNSKNLLAIIHDIQRRIAPYKNTDGTFSINPGCYIYSFEKT